jgi:nucleotidyltransferase substrate binding protein (TIGR01987 family)
MDRHTALLRKLEHKREHFERALEEFEDFCEYPISKPIEVAGLIQGFEFTYELAWKLLNVLCGLKGLDVNGPRDTLKTSFYLGIISDESTWLAMLDDRNSTTHRYDEELVKQLTLHIKTAYRRCFQKLKVVAQEVSNSGA